MMRIYYISIDCSEEPEKQRPAIMFQHFLRICKWFHRTVNSPERTRVVPVIVLNTSIHECVSGSNFGPHLQQYSRDFNLMSQWALNLPEDVYELRMDTRDARIE